MTFNLIYSIIYLVNDNNMNNYNYIPEFSHLNWYIDYFLKQQPQWLSLFSKNLVSTRVEEKSAFPDQEFENFKQVWQNFSTQNEQLALFLKNSFLPLLNPHHPLVKIFDTLNPSPGLDTHRNLFPDKLIPPQAKTCCYYPQSCSITQNITLKSSGRPDVLFVINSPLPLTPVPEMQTVMIMENKYSWINIAPRGELNLRMVKTVQQNISLITAAINQTAEIIKSQTKEYTFKRIPLPYNPVVEEIIDRLGFPPRAGIKLKSELLTDYLIVIWSNQ